MDENGTASKIARRTWPKRIGLALGIVLFGLIVFHRPILHSLGRSLAIHFAAKENLRLDCRIEGSVFGNLIIRNLHVTPTGPSAVESIDADFIRADYSLLDWWRFGTAELLKNVEVRNVNAVLNPLKAAPQKVVPKPNERLTLPSIFPERVSISDVSLLVRAAAPAQNLVLEHLDLELNPKGPGELRIHKLQIPSVPGWSNLAARTSYQNKDLIISGLVLDDETQLRSLSIDASQIKNKKLTTTIDCSLGGGAIIGSIALSETARSLEMDSRLSLKNISLDKLRNYAGRAAADLSGEVQSVEITANGALDAPRSWTGAITANATDLKLGATALDRITLNVTASGGVANIVSCDLARGPNKFSLSGNVTLPEEVAEFGRTPTSLHISGTLPELKAIAPEMAGSITIEGRADIVDATLNAALKVSSDAAKWNEISANSLTALITASRKMPRLDAQKPYFAGLQSETHLETGAVRSNEWSFDSLSAVIKSTDDLVTIERGTMVRADNSAKVSGTYRLPADLSQAHLQPADLQWSFDATNLGDFWLGDAAARVTGPLQIDGGIQLRDGVANGSLSIYGTNLRVKNLVIPEVSSHIAVYRNVVYVNDLTVNLSGPDFIRATGQFALDKPYRYKGSVAANISQLAQFKPILAAIGNKNELSGALVLDWSGSGQAANFNNSGEINLTLEKGRYANLTGLQARVNATYAPDGLNVPLIFFGSDKMNFQAVGESNGNTLEISKIEIDQGKAKYATGYAAIPFIWKNVGTDKRVFDPNGKVAITFQSENLDLKKLCEDIGAKPLGSGLLGVKLDAGGTLADMTARLEVQARELRSPAAPKFEPASFDLTADMKNNQLVVDGKIQQAKIQPVTIAASLPLNVGRILEQKRFDENTPITAKVEMPRSSVNFVRQFVPALERVDGDLALNVNVSGTVAKPVFSGSADTKINVARFSNATVPQLSNFSARLVFTNNDTLTLETFHGDVAGGPFTVSGRITFPKLTQPNFDLQLKADSVLVARNDDMTVRADANVRVAGPLTSATVSGDVGLTNSQFLKNIDLIPIGLPGRPAPGPKPPSDTPDLSFPNPPLRDWKFDVAIKTKDPFVIRGNLANGDALVDMKLTGTGLQPKLDGSVRLQNVEATLPFSRLEVQQGFIYFNPNDPLNPGIDLQGTSLIRDYTVHVYVYGTANEPQAIFSSEPPLPQEEIISLLATGTTKEELLSGGNVLAGRALMLLGQEMYRKIFKKGQATKPNSVFDKLSVDVGNVDPRTGQQTAEARFRVNEKFQVIGDIGVQGDFRGTVKYLIRFR